MLWDCNLEQYDPAFAQYTDKAREHGHYYSLTEKEVTYQSQCIIMIQ